MLELRGLTKRFGDLIAVNKVDLTVENGQTVALMGPSGCGKSTTIRMINRLIDPDAGNIRVGGVDMASLNGKELQRMRKRIGFVFQQFNLINRLTALENVMLGPIMDGVPREVAAAEAMEALRKVGMEAHHQHKSSEMSGGQQQRVGIARALVYQPELMLWDEPTASLDPILVREVLVIMEELARYRASAMLVVTHEISFALHAADQIALMDRGTIVEQGKPERVFTDPVSEVGCRYKELIEYQTQTNLTMLGGKRIA